jgi:hypothetical protein
MQPLDIRPAQGLADGLAIRILLRSMIGDRRRERRRADGVALLGCGERGKSSEGDQ